MAYFSVFCPKTTAGLIAEYPELGKIPELKDLKRQEILFVWYFSCKASPFLAGTKQEIIDNDNERSLASANKAFGKEMSEIDKDKYRKLIFPEKIRIAIDRMSRFDPGLRFRAKKVTSKILSDWEGLVSLDISNDDNFKNKDGEVDMIKKKNYVDLTIAISKNIDGLIQQNEGGFGVTDSDESDDDTDGIPLIENYVLDK